METGCKPTWPDQGTGANTVLRPISQRLCQAVLPRVLEQSDRQCRRPRQGGIRTLQLSPGSPGALLWLPAALVSHGECLDKPWIKWPPDPTQLMKPDMQNAPGLQLSGRHTSLATGSRVCTMTVHCLVGAPLAAPRMNHAQLRVHSHLALIPSYRSHGRIAKLANVGPQLQQRGW